MHGRAPDDEVDAHREQGPRSLQHLWVIYPGDMEYSLTEKITAVPLKKIRQIKVAN